VVVHPVAIRYHYKFDVRTAAAAVLDDPLVAIECRPF